MDVKAQPAAARHSILIGVLCGTGASFGWAAGFVAAKHGVNVGFAPADLALHRFFWTGLVPYAADAARRHRGPRRHRLGPRAGDEHPVRPAAGLHRLFRLYAGAARAWHHHPAGLRGAVRHHPRQLWCCANGRPHSGYSAAAIIVAACWCSASNRSPPSARHGVGGDLLFVTAGCFWATFGILLRHWRLPGMRAVAVVGALSVIVFAPLYLLFVGYDGILRIGLVRKHRADRRAGLIGRRAADLSVCARDYHCSAAAVRRRSRRWCRFSV